MHFCSSLICFGSKKQINKRLNLRHEDSAYFYIAWKNFSGQQYKKKHPASPPRRAQGSLFSLIKNQITSRRVPVGAGCEVSADLYLLLSICVFIEAANGFAPCPFLSLSVGKEGGNTGV